MTAHSPHTGYVSCFPRVCGSVQVKLFVGGLPFECSEHELRSVMGPYGNVLEIHLMKVRAWHWPPLAI